MSELKEKKLLEEWIDKTIKGWKTTAKQIKARLQKPEVDKKYIEAKARELSEMSRFFCVEDGGEISISMEEAKDFIRQLIAETQPQKPDEEKNE